MNMLAAEIAVRALAGDRHFVVRYEIRQAGTSMGIYLELNSSEEFLNVEYEKAFPVERYRYRQLYESWFEGNTFQDCMDNLIRHRFPKREKPDTRIPKGHVLEGIET